MGILIMRVQMTGCHMEVVRMRGIDRSRRPEVNV